LRYRLRLHLQEIDLLGDEVVIGRGSMGQITIEDPMLSRRHIRIDLSGPEPMLEDLRSRNGTQLNGQPLIDRAILRDGDRIRIGTQELVFLVPNVMGKQQRTTSGLTFCVGCAVPYPTSSPQCPHCGAIPTAHGQQAPLRDVAASGWTFHLLSQVVARALDQGRLADAERMMSRGVSELEQQIEAGMEVEPSRILGVAAAAARLGCALRSALWLEAAARLHGHAGSSPSREVLAWLDELPADPLLATAKRALRHAGSDSRRAG
jgi:hypothetical protein